MTLKYLVHGEVRAIVDYQLSSDIATMDIGLFLYHQKRKNH